MKHRQPRSTLFPYTTLFRSSTKATTSGWSWSTSTDGRSRRSSPRTDRSRPSDDLRERPSVDVLQDRKSTRLNSSHSQISYAVFCLKKKTKKRNKNEIGQHMY